MTEIRFALIAGQEKNKNIKRYRFISVPFFVIMGQNALNGVVFKWNKNL